MHLQSDLPIKIKEFMMISTAPTDNLYKFASVLGLSLLVFSVWQHGSTQEALELKHFEAQIDEIRAEKQVEFRLAEVDNWGLPPENLPERSQEQKLELFAERQQKLEKAHEDYAVAVTSVSKAELALDRFRNGVGEQLLLFQKVGALISLFSLALWFYRHQRLQDALLKAQMPHLESKRSQQERRTLFNRVYNRIA